jgi:hypothetical protein
MIVSMQLKKDDSIYTEIRDYKFCFDNDANKVLHIGTKDGMVDIYCNVEQIQGFIQQLQDQIKRHPVLPDKASNENTHINNITRKAV